MSGRYCHTCGEMDYSDWGDTPCACYYPPEPDPPSVEDYCASGGHAYYGDEADPATAPPDALVSLGRCYCGEKRYPAGGPKEGQP